MQTTTQVQRDAVPVSKLRNTGKSGKQGTSVSTAVQNGDAFAAIFEMMAQTLQQGNTQLLSAAGSEKGSTGEVQQTGGSQKADSNSLMQQLAGAMLAQYPQLAAFLQADDTQAQQMLTALQLPANAQQALLSLRQTLLSSLQQQTTAASTTTDAGTVLTQQVAAQSAQQTAESSQAETAQQSTKTNSGTNTAQEIVSGKEAQAGEQSGTTLLRADQFVQNVREAKKLMNNSQQKSGRTASTDSVDVDALQTHAQSARPLMDAASLKAANQTLPQATDLSAQIKKGVAENLLNGKQEFVIKLKPEGLGEITVKLTEKAGEATTLHLLTDNADTARLINSDLGTLKEAMRPLQVVVESAQSQQTGSGTQQQAAQQQTAQQQFNASSRHSGSHHSYYGFNGSAEETEADASAAEILQDDSLLNSYI